MTLHTWFWLKRWRLRQRMLVMALLAALALAGCQVGPLTIGAAAPPKASALPHGWSWYHDSVYPFDAPVPAGWQAHGYWFWYTRDQPQCARIVDLVRSSEARVQPLCILGFNFLLAVKQRLHRSLARPRLVRIKRPFDATQHDVQRNALLLPRLHQRPIERTEKEMLTTPADECVLDFGEIVEVVQALS